LAATGAALAWTAPETQAACPASIAEPVAHPRLFQGGTCETNGVKVPFLAWGQILLRATGSFGDVECVNLFYGYDENATEPGGSGNSEKAKAYDEILQASATGFLTPSFTAPEAKCRLPNLGVEAWLTPERPVQQQLINVDLQGRVTERTISPTERVQESTEENPTERMAIKGPFNGYTGPNLSYGLGHYRGRHRNEPPTGEGSNNTGTYRERSSTPWYGEAEATENEAKEQHFFVRTGVALAERAEVEAEEARAGTPTELRTGCYPHPETEKVTRIPGFGGTNFAGELKEEETVLRPAPEGCVEVNLFVPEAGAELVFQGTLEPQVLNGAHNCLTPSKGELKGTEERNGYHLESVLGAGYTTTKLAVYECGFRVPMPLLRLGLLP
jgi:hypothetical protein